MARVFQHAQKLDFKTPGLGQPIYFLFYFFYCTKVYTKNYLLFLILFRVCVCTFIQTQIKKFLFISTTVSSTHTYTKVEILKIIFHLFDMFVILKITFKR